MRNRQLHKNMTASMMNNNNTTAELLLSNSTDWQFLIQCAKTYPQQFKSYRSSTGQENCLFVLIQRDAPFDVIDTILTIHPNSAKEVNALTGLTALHLAVSRGRDTNIIERLVQAWPEAVTIPSRLSGGSIPLHSVQNLETAKLLVESNLSCVGIQNIAGYIPLHRAAYATNVSPDVVQYLITKGKEFGKRENSRWLRLRNSGSEVLGNHGGALTETINGITPLDAAIEMISKSRHANKFFIHEENGNEKQQQHQRFFLDEVAVMKWEKLVHIVTAANEAREEKELHANTTTPRSKNDLVFDNEEKKKSEKTPLLHAMLAMNVPAIFIKYALAMHPEQAFLRDVFGNTALHVALFNQKNNICTVRLLLKSKGKKQAAMLSSNGRLPLHTHISKNVGDWIPVEDHILKLLIQLEPRAIETRDGVTGLYPFALAAVASAERQNCIFSNDLNMTYLLLREAPWLVSRMGEIGSLQQERREQQQIKRRCLWRYFRVQKEVNLLSLQVVVQWIVPLISSLFVAYYLVQRS